MSSKKRLRHRKKQLRQMQNGSQRLKNQQSVQLEPGEIGLIADPKDPRRIKTFVTSDGSRISLDNSYLPTKIPHVDPSLFVTRPEIKGTRNTLAYRFGEMLTIAQDMFGPRDPSCVFLGIEFTPGHGRLRHVGGKNYVIHLDFDAMYNPMEAYIGLAHECIHLLSPDIKPATILEEGVAMYFSLHYMQETMKLPPPPITLESYREATDLVSMVMNIDPDGIKKMREEEFVIRKISKPLIMKYYPTIPEGVAARLARTFVRGEDDDPRVLELYNLETQLYS